MNARKYAKSVGFEVVGKLHRIADYRNEMDSKQNCYVYLDDAGNEYWISENDACIITCDGGVL